MAYSERYPIYRKPINMPEKIKTLKNKTTNHVFRHRGKYGIAAGAGATLYILNKVDRVAEWNEFLKEHDLLDEFYALAD